MQDQVPETAATIVMSGNNPIVNIPPGLSAPPNYISPTDNSVKNLEDEQKTLSTGANLQIQTASQVNFTSVVTNTSASTGTSASTPVGVGTNISAGGYTPISSVAHMFSNQPAVSFTPGK